MAQLGVAPAHVAGFSLGALVGLELAVAHPRVVRSVVGVGAHYTPDAKTHATLQGLDPDRLERADPGVGRRTRRLPRPDRRAGPLA